MADRLDELVERVASLEEKVNALPASIEARFDAVDLAFADGYKFAEYLVAELRTEVREGFRQMDDRFANIDARFENINARLENVDVCVGQVASGSSRVERKLDQFIDTQSTANELAERRLVRLENA